RVRRNGGNLTRQDEALAPRRAWAAFMGMTAVQHQSGAVEPVLEKFLVGIVADRCRHDAARVGDHAVAGDDDIAFDAPRSDHETTIAGAGAPLRSTLRPCGVRTTARPLPLSIRTRPSMIASSQTDNRGQLLRQASMVSG